VVLLDAARIRPLLAEFVERLGDTGARFDGIVVGGAALALGAIPDRSATQDIDTFAQLSDDAKAIVSDIAERESLRKDWLNTKAQQFMSPLAIHRDEEIIFEHKDVKLRLMDNRTLLALKLRAGRISKDAADIAALLDLVGVTTVEEAQAIHDDYYGGEEIFKKVSKIIVEAHLDGRRLGGGEVGSRRRRPSAGPEVEI